MQIASFFFLYQFLTSFKLGGYVARLAAWFVRHQRHETTSHFGHLWGHSRHLFRPQPPLLYFITSWITHSFPSASIDRPPFKLNVAGLRVSFSSLFSTKIAFRLLSEEASYRCFRPPEPSIYSGLRALQIASLLSSCSHILFNAEYTFTDFRPFSPACRVPLSIQYPSAPRALHPLPAGPSHRALERYHPSEPQTLSPCAS